MFAKNMLIYTHKCYEFIFFYIFYCENAKGGTMNNIRELLAIIVLIAMILIALFGSLIDASWLEPYCLITFVLTLIYGLFIRRVI